VLSQEQVCILFKAQLKLISHVYLRLSSSWPEP
jgi:hypothetical protein